MSISSLSSGASSPLKRLQDQLATRIASGTIKAEDKTALSSALESIDSTLQAGRSSAGRGSRPDPAAMKSKIEGLVDQQVSAGTLTSDQAGELKQLFADAAPKGGGMGGAKGGPGGPGGAGGPPPGPPPGEGQERSGASGTGSSSSSSSSSDLLAGFLKQLQAQLTSGGYGASGTSRSSGSTSFVVDYAA